MKHFLLIGMVFGILIGGYAHDWNPKIAYWIYNSDNMEFHGDLRVSYLRDTLVNGKDCQILQKDMLLYEYILKTYSYQLLGNEVTYYESGVTYILNNHQFDTLYYFAGNINDRYSVTGRLKWGSTDRAYAVIADTGTVTINAQKLKWQAVDYNFERTGNHYSLRDTIIEKIGSTKYYFLPWDFINGMVDGNEGGGLKCFHDSTLGIYSSTPVSDCKFDLNLVSPKSYEPFISESKQWKYVQEAYLTGGSGGSDGTFYFVNHVYFRGDTIVDNVTYSKLYREEQQPTLQKPYLAYLMREDTVNQKVYVFDIVYKKHALLYDFKLVKGDKFNMYHFSDFYTKHTVVKADTITLANKKLKRIEFDGSITWIEGIGAVTQGYIPSAGVLICMRDKDDLWYLNPKFSNCDTIFTQGPWDNIQTIQSNEVMVFPNPVVSTSVVRVNAPYNDKLKIEIYSYSGVLVREDYFSSEYPIGSLQLAKGMYVYRIFHNTQVIKMDKIIVANQ